MALSGEADQTVIEREIENYLDKCEALKLAVLPTLNADYEHRNRAAPSRRSRRRP